MTTDYTARIEDGSITTGEEFLRLCTRALSIAHELKDEPLSVPTPIEFYPNMYFKNMLEEDSANYDKFKNISLEDAKNEMIRAYVYRVDTYKTAVKNSLSKNEKYNKIRREVESWIPPTKDHVDLKSFALEQIDMGIDNQKLIDECQRISEEKLDDSEEAVKAYIKEQIDFYREKVEKWQELWDSEVKRADEYNIWMEQFLDSLKSIQK